MSDDDVFEMFCANVLLRDADLSYQQIANGIVDGSKDGGIDAIYLFVDRSLVEEDTDLAVFKNSPEIEIVILQAKNQESFKEGPVDKLSSSLPMLLDLSVKTNSLVETYNEDVISGFERYRDVLGTLSSRFPSIKLSIYYCAKADEPNSVIIAKSISLEKALKKLVTGDVHAVFVDSDLLYEKARAQSRYVGELNVVSTPLFGNSSYVALCKLSDYTKFISHPGNSLALLTRLFESNVRDYQGDVEVNQEIAFSLSNKASGIDFWWLNNVVTIVADRVSFQNGKLNLENPVIVNGLQTSHEVHKYSTTSSDTERSIMVRVIQETDPAKLDQIIKATNKQTAMKASSLRATDDIHRRIEEYFFAHALFYDRRKNYYKNLGKPADRIVSIDKLAQAVISTLLRRPHDARARPTTLIKSDKDYKEIFSEDESKRPLECYRVLAEFLIQIEAYFKKSRSSVDRRYLNNLKFHTLMVAIWNCFSSKDVPATGIAQLKVASFTEALISDSLGWVIVKFAKEGGEDRVAKDENLLVSAWEKR
jgi:hypothetical protein